MTFEVTIPDWTEGKALTVKHIEAETADEAKGKAAAVAPTCPLDLMTARKCRCNPCSDADLKAFMASLRWRFK